MRTLLAIVLFAGAVSVQAPSADAARKSVRGVYGYYHPVPRRGLPRAYSACQQRARADDPDGVFGGFPCWARSAFGQGRR
jgi:hypothetical protein